MSGTLLLILLILLLAGSVLRWGYSRGCGYTPMGLMGRVPVGF
ncbi:DUF3309 family protein [Legionella spiritensis]|nr:DUF3309 family protein [Legionella spiritensis]